jgi:hypothetical protein
VVFGFTEFIDLAPVVSCFEGFAAHSAVSLSRSASPTPATPAAFKKMRRLLLVHLMTSAWSSMASPLLTLSALGSGSQG